jgi:hypothetical protein
LCSTQWNLRAEILSYSQVSSGGQENSGDKYIRRYCIYMKEKIIHKNNAIDIHKKKIYKYTYIYYFRGHCFLQI